MKKAYLGHSNVSLIQRCPYFRVSFKRGSTVHRIVGNYTTDWGVVLHSIHVPTDRWRRSEASEWPQSLERVEHSGAIGPGGQSAPSMLIGWLVAYTRILSLTPPLYYRNATAFCV